MSDSPHPVRRSEDVAAILEGYRCGDEILACDRHAPIVEALIERINAGTPFGDLDDELLVRLGECLRCSLCSAVADAANSLTNCSTDNQASPAITNDGGSGIILEFPDRNVVPRHEISHVADVQFHRAAGGVRGDIIQARRLIFAPWYPKEPICTKPFKKATEEEWPGVSFGSATQRGFGDPFPEARIDADGTPVLVTNPFRYLYEYERGADWAPIIPLTIAPQDTLIVAKRGGRFADVNPAALAGSLGGKRIAVADLTSTHAARLMAAARRHGLNLKVSDSAPHHVESDTFHLVSMPFASMVQQLREDQIDAIATVEPLPSLAEELLNDPCKYLTLNHECIAAASLRMCCLVVAPIRVVEDRRYKHSYEALVSALFRSVCRLLYRDAAVEIVDSSFGQLIPRGVRSEVVAQRAATEMLKHLLDPLDPGKDTPDHIAKRLAAELVPDVAPTFYDEYEALYDHLSEATGKRWRAAKPVRRPQSFYDLATIRGLCLQAIRAELGTGQNLAATIRQLKILRESA